MSVTTPAHAAGAEPFLGQIITTPYNFCPRGYFPANGQLLSIAQNTALFALLGTTYGGNGTTTFGLPNLQGRAPTGRGQGPGLPAYSQGEVHGSNAIQLTVNNLPAHTHTGTLRAVSGEATTSQPGGNSLAVPAAGTNIYSTAVPANNMNVGDVELGATGGGQLIYSETPYLTLNYCIAFEGIFPSRP